MVQIPLGTSEWESKDYDLAEIRLRNMYIADNPYSPDGVSRYPRPSLVEHDKVGSGSGKGIFWQAGVLDNQFFVVVGEQLWGFFEDSDPYLIGSIPGTETCQFAGTIDKLVIVRDGVAYATDGVTIAPIVMPDGDPVGSVASIDGVFLLSVLGFYRFYWMNPGESAPDPLNFASAERAPDPIVSINVVADEIWFIGSDSIEVWAQTGDQDAPYSRIAGRAYTDGLEYRDSVAASSFNGFPCLMWVTNNYEVVLAQGNPQKISNEYVEEELRDSTNIRGWAFRRLRNDFYVISTDNKTLVFNLTKKSWAIWDSYDFSYWRAHLGTQKLDRIYAVDTESNRVFKLEENAFDLIDDPIVCHVRGFVPLTEGHVPCKSVDIRANQGWTQSYVTAPVLELSWSDDYGFTWSEPYQVTFGTKGAYSTELTFRSLGLMERPGRLFQVSFSGLERFRIDYATMNEV